MIFLTVGTQLPFDRLVRAVDDWCRLNPKVRVFAQIGTCGRANWRPRHMDWVERLSPALYASHCEAARFMISHTGMGSIITAASLRKPLVMLPRRQEFGEHRNDHQLSTAARFRGKAGLFVADEADDLAALLDHVDRLADQLIAADAISPFADVSLTDAVRAFISAEPKARLTRQLLRSQQ